MNTLAFDLGGSRIKIGYVKNGEVIGFRMIPVPEGATFPETLEACMENALPVIPENDRNNLGSVGIGYPGLVSFSEKRIVSASGKYTSAPGFDVEKWAGERFGCGCVVENDANAALYGEIKYGSAQGETDAVMMILGTGVGTSAVMGGRTVRGAHGQAGCLGGHFPVGPVVRRCSCGGCGCVEANGSTWALADMLAGRPGWSRSPLRNEKKIDFRALEKAVNGNDPAAVEVFEECVTSWARGIVSMVYAFDPEVVVLSGGVTNMGEKLLSPLRRKVLENVWTPWGKLRFITAEEPEKSVVRGLYALAEDEIKTKNKQ